VRIAALPLEGGDRKPNFGSSETTSGADGRFRIDSLLPVVHNVHFLGTAERPKLTAEAIEGVRIRAGGTTAVLLKAMEGRKLSGVVTDADTGKPLPGVSIGYEGTARPQSGNDAILSQTDSQGRFEFFVPPGHAHVFVVDRVHFKGRFVHQTLNVPEDRDPEPVEMILFRNPPAPPNAPATVYGDMAKAAVSPLPATNSPPTVAASPAPAEKPRVIATHTLTGRVIDEAGRPVSGVRVSYWIDSRYDSAVSDRDGTFQMSGLPKKNIPIDFGKEGYQAGRATIRADRDTLELQLVPERDRSAQPPKRSASPVPPEVIEKYLFVDLQPRGTDRLVVGPGGYDNDLSDLPQGAQKLGDVWFDVGAKFVHVFGQNASDMPPKIGGIKVGARVRTLHLLHATQWSVANGTEIGAYSVTYTDGTQERIPIVYGESLCNWWGNQTQELPSRAKVVWGGATPAITSAPGKMTVRLFAMPWRNPHPEKVVATIGLASALTLCDPFVVAITAEK
jgi:hypothetical protein